MTKVPVEERIEEIHNDSLDRRLDRRTSTFNRVFAFLGLCGAIYIVANIAGSVAPDGVPAREDIVGIEACANDQLADITVDKSSALAAINFCTDQVKVTLLDTELRSIERAVAPAIDFEG